MLTRDQQLLNAGNGFLGALAILGKEEFSPSNLMFEMYFLSAWSSWTPSRRLDTPVFDMERRRPRDLLSRISRSHSAFKTHAEQLSGLMTAEDAREYVVIHANGASLDEWLELAEAYLAEEARVPGSRR